MSKAIHIEENANILLFLAHVSRDPVIIEEMVNAAKVHFRDEESSTLGKEVKFLDDLGYKALGVTYEELEPREVRSRMLEAKDAAEEKLIAGRADASPPDDESLDADYELISSLEAALKTLQILGQMLKNFPGSIKSSAKLEIGRECYGLGLRSLSVLLNYMRTNQRDSLLMISDVLREQHPWYTVDQAWNQAKFTLAGMTHLISHGLIKAVSLAVGSPELSGTYDKLLDEKPTPARHLIRTSLALDHDGGFPGNKIKSLAKEFEHYPLALSILRQLVVDHFYLFPTPYDVKQRACQILNVPYKSVQGGRPGRLLLGRGKSS